MLGLEKFFNENYFLSCSSYLHISRLKSRVVADAVNEISYFIRSTPLNSRLSLIRGFLFCHVICSEISFFACAIVEKYRLFSPNWNDWKCLKNNAFKTVKQIGFKSTSLYFLITNYNRYWSYHDIRICVLSSSYSAVLTYTDFFLTLGQSQTQFYCVFLWVWTIIWLFYFKSHPSRKTNMLYLVI